MEKQFSNSKCRRSYQRYLVESFGNISLGKEEFPVFVKNMSVQGMGLVSNFNLDLGQEVLVQAYVSLNDDPVTKKARVIWCNENNPKLFYSGINFDLEDRGLSFIPKG